MPHAGIFAHRAQQAIGAHAVTLGSVDAVVFTGGIGENSGKSRRMICEGLSCLGLELGERRPLVPEVRSSGHLPHVR